MCQLLLTMKIRQQLILTTYLSQQKCIFAFTKQMHFLQIRIMNYELQIMNCKL
jgi:hypothetical protein